MASKTRLIDANALADEIDGIYQRHYANSAYQFIHDFFRAVFRRIHKSPTVDVEEVVHGRWVLDDYGCYCSACGRFAADYDRTPYCSKCGAKMDK